MLALAAPALVSMSLAFAAVAGSPIGTRIWALHWIALGLALLVAERRTTPKPVLVGFLVIIASFWIAVPMSLFRGDDFWTFNLRFAIFISPMLLFFVVRASSNVFAFLAPFAFIQAAIVLYQGLWLGEYRPSGLIDSPNPSAGLLTIAAAYLMTTRFWWLSPVLVIGVAVNGSRLALLALFVVAALMVITGRVSWRKWLVVVVVSALVSIPWWQPIAQGLRIYQGDQASVIGGTSDKAGRDVLLRLHFEKWITLLPSGAVTYGDGPVHNVPARIATELGVLAALAWLLLTLWGLLSGEKFTVAWFGLLLVAILGMLDYYVFIGPLAGIWWMLLGMRANEAKRDAIQNVREKRRSRTPVERRLAVQTHYTIASFMKPLL